jgi:ribose transport system permease protein
MATTIEPAGRGTTWTGLMRRADPVVLTAIILVLVWGYSLLRVPGYRTLDYNLFTLRVTAFLAIVAAGQTLVVLAGGIDISIAGTISLAGVVGGVLIGNLGEAAGILATLFVVALVGLANGLGIVILRLPPLVMTLASLSIIQGGLLIYNAGNPVSSQSPFLTKLANDSIWSIPTPVIVALIVVAIGVFLLKGTTYGRGIYAIGTNPRAAALSGVPVAAFQVATYVLCALCAGITGLLLLGWTGYSYLNMGDPYLLTSIAAVVVGGTSILGGRGSLWGTIFGALLLNILVNILVVEKIPEAGRIMVQGALILALLIVYAVIDEGR